MEEASPSFRALPSDRSLLNRENSRIVQRRTRALRSCPALASPRPREPAPICRASPSLARPRASSRPAGGNDDPDARAARDPALSIERTTEILVSGRVEHRTHPRTPGVPWWSGSLSPRPNRRGETKSCVEYRTHGRNPALSIEPPRRDPRISSTCGVPFGAQLEGLGGAPPAPLASSDLGRAVRRAPRGPKSAAISPRTRRGSSR